MRFNCDLLKQLFFVVLLWTGFVEAENLTFTFNQTSTQNCCELKKNLTFNQIKIQNKGDQPLLNFYLTTNHNAYDFKIRTLSPQCFEYISQKESVFFNTEAKLDYPQWDNHTPSDHEAVAQDPLLFLRRHGFSETEIGKAAYAYAELDFFNFTPSKKHYGEQANLFYDLFPQEELIYKIDSSTRLYTISQKVNLSQRSLEFTYKAPFPIICIENQSSQPIHLSNIGITLETQEVHQLSEPLNLLNISTSQPTQGVVKVFSIAPLCTFPALDLNPQGISLNAQNSTTIEVAYEEMETNDQPLLIGQIETIENDRFLDFYLSTDLCYEKISWQIASHSEFLANTIELHHEEVDTKQVRLTAFSESFLNPAQTYYFRLRGYQNKEWTQWSSALPFRVEKPLPPLNPSFHKETNGEFDLTWDPPSDQPLTYWIYGSNAIDFIPSLYFAQELKGVDEKGGNQVYQQNDNLIIKTTSNHVTLEHPLPFYRIIAEHNGHFSLPSPLIYLYDQQLCLPRTCLKITKSPLQQASRKSIQPVYPNSQADLIPLYTPAPHIHPHVWAYVQPYLLPENHPAKYKLDRIFTRTRATLNAASLQQAGFNNNVAGLYSGAVVTTHPKIKGYFIKLFTDDCPQRLDWKQWTTRIQGAQSIKKAIVQKGYHKMFKVPQKWIYPLPPEPSPPLGHHRHDFILIAEEMDILPTRENYSRWRKKMTPKLLEAFYTLVKEEGLSDSVYAFNLPFCYDGKLAFIDTEHHHEWPVYFQRTLKYLSESMGQYLAEIDARGGP